MSKGERMMLSDAIEACILAERKCIVLKAAVGVLCGICCVLGACLSRR